LTHPALVSQKAVRPIPRWALWCLCAAYIIPGVLGRSPWKSADLTAYGFMHQMANGQSSWWQPSLGGLSSDGALLPYWIGAISIQLMGASLGPALAARIPFACLLAVSLALCWYTTYHLARTPHAQPLPLAFGGEAQPTDYARTLADASVLALMATLGLLQLGHETTPELVQMPSLLLAMYAIAAAPFRPAKSRLALSVALPALAISGAPSLALAVGLAACVILWRSAFPEAKALWPWALLATVLSAAVASIMQAWAWRIGSWHPVSPVGSLLQTLVWFAWPLWPLVMWALWQWRRHWQHRHIAIPASLCLILLMAFVLMGGSDRALMLAMPAAAVLAAFALPTLRRATSAAIDWFSLLCASLCAIVIWVVYVAVHTGHPWQPAANVKRLLPGFEAQFSAGALALALVATLAWLGLVRWRTRAHPHALWKSLVLPASGVALCWLLLNTLWLPMLDYARSYRPLLVRLQPLLPAGSCVEARGLRTSLIAALVTEGAYAVASKPMVATSACAHVLIRVRPGDPRIKPPGLDLIAEVSHPADTQELILVYRRLLPSPP
jgi:hypothetical protein